jgi:hypothetical protein
MKKQLMYALLLASISFCMTHAMETEEMYEGNSYKGNLISVNTLPQLAQEYTPLPNSTKNELQEWLQNDVTIPNNLAIEAGFSSEEYSDEPTIKQNQDIIAYLAQLPQDLSKARAKSELNKQLLKIIAAPKEPYTSLNYIFEPIDGSVLRMAGVPNRLYSIISGQDIGDKWLDPYGQAGQVFIKNLEERKNLIVIPTYHTISMYTNYLLLKKFIEENNLTHIITPDTYLVHIPNRPAAVSDNNYVVLQNKVNGNLVNVSTNPCAWATLSDEAIQELFIAARVGLWNIEGNLLVDNNGNIVILALEQPNNSDPRAALNKPMAQEWGAIRGRGAYARYIVDGIELIMNMMKKAEDKCPSVTHQLALWKILIQNNDNLVQHLNQSQQDRLDRLGQESEQ